MEEGGKSVLMFFFGWRILICLNKKKEIDANKTVTNEDHPSGHCTYILFLFLFLFLFLSRLVSYVKIDDRSLSMKVYMCSLRWRKAEENFCGSGNCFQRGISLSLSLKNTRKEMSTYYLKITSYGETENAKTTTNFTIKYL